MRLGFIRQTVRMGGVFVWFICHGGSAVADGDMSMSSQEHWSFQPLAAASIPQVSNSSWPHNPIDHFILERLEEAGLSPAREADPVTLVRRLHFTLTGLPPSPTAVEEFLADASEEAYLRRADRLLASPDYGEQWARHWLDVVRFAESHGFETNLERENAWPYRDYVIDAFNDDKPYDQFIFEQLAGDMVRTDAATGFLVAGAWDAVKSPDINLTLQQRMDELDDMISATSATFLGLTVGCARCHDHKFDPISQVDYYAMQAVFAGVQHGERPIRPDDYQARLDQAEAEREAIAEIEDQLIQFAPLADPSLKPDSVQSGSSPPSLRPAVNARLNVDRFAPTPAKRIRFTVLETSEREPCIDELEVYSAEDETNVALATAGSEATASGTYPNSEIHKLEHINDGRTGNSHSWISDQVGEGWVELEFDQTVTIDKVIWSRDRQERFTDRLATRYRIEVSVEPGQWTVVAASNDREPYEKGLDPKAPFSSANLSSGEKRQLEKLLAEKEEREQKVEELTTFQSVYAGQFEQPEPTHRLHRGEPMQKREVVSPGAPEALSPELTLPMDAPEQERRVALARWLVDRENPLTARVMVNRLWHYHFGAGIVRTPSDFGRMGAEPTHPELLDWLAAEFINSGWSIKHVQRLIVTSSTYRQSSQPNSEGLAADVEARLLWRFPPRRLTAESIRDSILSISGNLNRVMGGPGFDLFQPNDNYVKVYIPKRQFGPDEWRRMIYHSKPRMELDDTFGVFDCPDAAQPAPDRNQSTTPLQALSLLNSPFALQQASLFAERLQREAGEDHVAQVNRAFLLAFNREPLPVEKEAGLELIRDHGLMIFCRTLFNANEFLYIF